MDHPKKIWTWLVLLACAAPLTAQWREKAADLLRGTKDYAALSDLLLKDYDSMESGDRADAAGLLAFCFAKRNDRTNEVRWIVEYFEKTAATDSGYAFLDLISQSDVLGYLSFWKGRYPWIEEISFIQGIGDQAIIPQGILPLVVEISNEAYYKFSLGTDILKGGMFNSGFNIISLDANELFARPGTRVYMLEIKAAGLILKKEVTLDVEVSSPAHAQPLKAQPSAQVVEYTLSLYVDGELVMSSKKIEKPNAWTIGVKPSVNPFGFKPDYWVNRNQPGLNSVPIFSAIGVIYSLLKDLLTKKNKKGAEAPQIKTAQDMTIVFKQTDAAGHQQETRISLKLRTKNLPYILTIP